MKILRKNGFDPLPLKQGYVEIFPTPSLPRDPYVINEWPLSHGVIIIVFVVELVVVNMEEPASRGWLLITIAESNKGQDITNRYWWKGNASFSR